MCLGKAEPEPCGVKVPAKRGNTTGLKGHIRDAHPKEFAAVNESSGNIRNFLTGGSAQNALQRDKVALAFAYNALPYQVSPLPRPPPALFPALCPQLIEEKNFKGAFGEKIPTGFNRHELSSHTKALKDKVERRLLDRLQDEDVFLMVDGGTLNRKRLLNACIGNEGVSYFYRSIRVESLRADQVATSLQEIIDQLSREKVYVFCIVADNAAAFQKAGQLFESYAGADSDDEDVADVDEGQALPDALQILASRGVFCVRCAAHSLQLVRPPPHSGNTGVPISRCSRISKLLSLWLLMLLSSSRRSMGVPLKKWATS